MIAVVLCLGTLLLGAHFSAADDDDQALMNLAYQLQYLKSQLQLQAYKVSILERETTSIKADVDRKNPQVAFSVGYSIGGNLDLGTQGTVKYPKIITNVGNGYDPLTGIFTAPYAGTYAFFATLRSTNDQKWIMLGIVKGNEVLAQFMANGDLEHWDRGSGLVTTHLRQWEQVCVRQTAGGTHLEASILTNFSGMLLAAD